MKLQLTGIKASGLRCAELDLTFGDKSPPQFTFIQMPNGTGKTTLAECLRAALSGEASTWGADRVRSFQRVTGSDSGLFEARFALNGSPLAIGLRFNFIEETVSYYTTIHRGRVPKLNLPAPLARFADPGFVRLYIFDAELPQELLAGGSDRAERAIDAFYQLYVLGQIADAVQSYWESQVQGASTHQGLARYKHKLENLKKRQRQLQSALARDRAELDRVRADLGAKGSELDDHLSEVQQYRHHKASLEEELRDAEAGLTAGMVAVIARLQRPLDSHPGFRAALDHLTAGLDSLRLPESTSREFFRDLTEQPMCICGATMTDDAREHIARAAESLLADDAAGVVNALKTDVRTFQRDDTCPALSALADDLGSRVRRRDAARHSLDILVSDTSEKADEHARNLKERIDTLSFKQQTLTASVNALTREVRPDDDEETTCLKWFEQEIRRIEQAVADATRLVTLRERKDDLRQLLTDAARHAREAARRELVRAMNERLGSLLPGENLTVVDIRPYLMLQGRKGVNLGAMLSIGYSFLTTLFERGNHEFPFIVDAPTMGLDGLAREALADILPRATRQFVGFVLDNERDFTRRIRDNVPDRCEFYTVFSDSSRNRPLADQVPEGAQAAEAGTYVIRGFDFFNKVVWAKSEERSDA